MKINYKQNDILCILWHDANSEDRKWLTVDDFSDISPEMKILSLGFFICEQAGYIRIASDLSKETNQLHEVINRTINIPLSCIKSIKKIG